MPDARKYIFIIQDWQLGHRFFRLKLVEEE